MVLPRSESQNICVVTVRAVKPSLTVEGNADPGHWPVRIDLVEHAGLDAAVVEDVGGAVGDGVDAVAPEAAHVDIRDGQRAEGAGRLAADAVVAKRSWRASVRWRLGSFHGAGHQAADVEALQKQEEDRGTATIITVTPACTAPQSMAPKRPDCSAVIMHRQREFRLVGDQHQRGQELVPGAEKGKQRDR